MVLQDDTGALGTHVGSPKPRSFASANGDVGVAVGVDGELRGLDPLVADDTLDRGPGGPDPPARLETHHVGRGEAGAAPGSSNRVALHEAKHGGTGLAEAALVTPSDAETVADR